MKILAVTGIRSEYDYIFPALNELRKFNHLIKVVVSGAHLSHLHNETWNFIKKDKFIIADRIDSLLSSNRLTQRPKGISAIINGLTQTVERENPDIILVVGDREESIATAIVGNYMQKIVVHIGGGETASGNADDPIRFAVSKLSHVHCCTSLEYKKNLIKIGEEKFRIFNTGSPSYVNIDKIKKIKKEKLFQLLKINKKFNNYLMLIKHPLSSEMEHSYSYMKKTLEALKDFCHDNNFVTVCISPNSDPGSNEINRAIKEFSSQGWLYSYNTLPRDLFVNLMRNTRVLVGNSSMGILEAPYYRLPVINIGNRQIGRLNAGNVKFINYSKKNILNALKISCFDKKYINKIKKLKNPYGDNTAAKKIRKVIESIDIDDKKWYIKRKLC
ncbi:MAG: UDP-N,N'-diacetylbacillosamine 2-epimerase (hydrolyzing) [Alphaproteobacteria bacterium MarineAlpha5_Bin8]|nr:MAG: UDP-N,N'-diacetylbacillosamine 2-epimerase (hydrolyzing) [Alphaproteobacteria bacterium MarineAlpha5_Bin8]PPR54561.1 MAG: UDP-N,N'-diacetylbacillosamine 2-epimerase (hydrolyzing) [Alphaproteobacteria bacterium MarineAlpha5_Bin6]|tara:strand:- start:16 stop:1176 length:1161 start_codon:yes stop_codon:yes gene_type:complete